MSKIANIIIRKLSSKEEMLSALPIIIQHHKHIDQAAYAHYIDEILAEKNYQMIGAYIDDKLVAIAGYWVLTRFYSGKYIQVGNMVVDNNFRSQGAGKKMLQFIENEGKKQGCQHFILDSRSDNKKSHRFYFREGFTIMGFHFMKDI